LALGAARAEVVASASEAAGGEFEGGLEHWSGGPKVRGTVGGRVHRLTAFRCSPGSPPGSLRACFWGCRGVVWGCLFALFKIFRPKFRKRLGFLGVVRCCFFFGLARLVSMCCNLQCYLSTPRGGSLRMLRIHCACQLNCTD